MSLFKTMKITDVYGSPAPSKSRHYTDPEPLLTEDEVRQRMSDISRRWVDEREVLRTAYTLLAKREAKAQLAIKFLQPDLLYNADAKAYVQKASDEKVKMTVGDIDAVIMLEMEEAKINYDLAKFDCETSDSDFKKLEPQLSFYQSLLKLK